MLMARVELEVPDAPGCPLLGLAVDRRTRYTFPHPGHRCYASGSPSKIDPGHQSTYCLCLEFAACDRYVGHAASGEVPINTPNPRDPPNAGNPRRGRNGRLTSPEQVVDDRAVAHRRRAERPAVPGKRE